MSSCVRSEMHHCMHWSGEVVTVTSLPIAAEIPPLFSVDATGLSL